MLTWRIEALHLKLKHPRNTAAGALPEKTNFLVQVADGTYSGFGEAAPSIRFGETPELLLKQYQVLLMAGLPGVGSMEELLQLLLEHQPVNSLRFAVESAYLHYYCQHRGIAVHHLLGQQVPGQQPTCFTLPDIQPEQVRPFFYQYGLGRFSSIKVRVHREQGLELVQEVLHTTDGMVAIDGCESWQDPDELLEFMSTLDRDRILFLEQPMPASHAAAYAHVKKLSPFPLIADESVTDDADFELLYTQFHGISIKLMKAGGYLNAVRLLRETKKHGMISVIGCMLETTLGVWSAMQLSSAFDFADLSSFMCIEGEPFELVREQGGVLYLK
ncbi:MAG: hypothetical protein LPK07_12820 [Hymenobacteraceae bacterium]|nr:hypothetical protein [Hymenobacteraceae bacterium]